MTSNLTLTEFIPGGKVKAQEINGNFTTLKEAVESKIDSSDTSITKQGNTFNGANQLLQLNSSGQIPAVDASLLTGINTGLLPIVAKGTVTSDFILDLNKINTASINSNITISLPAIGFLSGFENKCILDFSLTNGCTLILPAGIKWKGGFAPSSYSTLSDVRNIIEFTTRDNGTSWEAEYKTYGGILTTFNQPALGANGTIGGSTFAVYTDANVYSVWYLWKAFNNDGGVGIFATNVDVDFNIIIYNPIPLIVSNFAFQNTANSNAYGALGGLSIYGSNDNSNYTYLTSYTNSNITNSATWNVAIPTASQAPYKYYKMVSTSAAGSYSSCAVGEILLTAQYIAQ